MGRYKNDEVINQIVEKQPESIQEDLRKYLSKMCKKYGSLEEFKKTYITALVAGENIVPKNIRRAFVCYIDINQPDCVCREQMEYMYLLESIYNNSGIFIINSENSALIWQNAMKKISLKEQDIIIRRFGLYGRAETLSTISKEYNVTKEYIRQVEERALEKFRSERCRKIFAPYVEEVIDANREDELVREFFKYNSIFRDDSNINSKPALERFVQLAKNEHDQRLEDATQIMRLSRIKRSKIIDSTFPNGLDIEKLKYLTKRAKSRYTENKTISKEDIIGLSEEIPANLLSAIYKQAAESEAAKDYKSKSKRVNRSIKNNSISIIKRNPSLLELGINEKVCEILRSENIVTLADVLTHSVDELKHVKGLSRSSIISILLMLHKYGFAIEDEEMKNEVMKIALSKKQAKKVNIEDVGFSPRTAQGLKRAGINTLGDLVNYSAEEIMEINNIGEKCFEEIIFIMNCKGLKLKESTDTNKSKNKKQPPVMNPEFDFSLINEPIAEEEEEQPSEAYNIALQLFEEFCNNQTTIEEKEEIKRKIKELFKDLDDSERVLIRGKIYKQIEKMSKDESEPER
jgi:DNA-directed RNA polymerase alpha subunit